MVTILVSLISLLLGFTIGQGYAYYKVKVLLKKCDETLKMSNEFTNQVLNDMRNAQNLQ